MNILSNIPPLDLPWQSSLGNLTCLFFKIFFILCLGWAEQRIASQFFLGKKSYLLLWTMGRIYISTWTRKLGILAP